MRPSLWHQLQRGVRRHFGPTAAHVAVQPRLSWFWRSLIILLLLLFGYLAGYWQFAAGDLAALAERTERTIQENQSLQARIVHYERQLQVEQAAQTNLAKELAALQEEDMRIKEEIEFYKSILKVSPGAAGELKLHSFKLSKGALANQYNYNILLMQSGRHDKLIQGQLNLVLQGVRGGQAVSLPVGGTPEAQGIKINFKYYQRVEGNFSVPDDMTGQALEANFMAIGAGQPHISRKMDLPV
jgi:hypothetical protein